MLWIVVEGDRSVSIRDFGWSASPIAFYLQDPRLALLLSFCIAAAAQQTQSGQQPPDQKPQAPAQQPHPCTPLWSPTAGRGRDQTPPGFGFSRKVPKKITYEKALLDCRDEVLAFLDSPRRLGAKLLCCQLLFG